jgi:hypothetical protein
MFLCVNGDNFFEHNLHIDACNGEVLFSLSYGLISSSVAPQPMEPWLLLAFFPLEDSQ